MVIRFQRRRMASPINRVRLMALFKWSEITTTAWIIRLVISAGIVLMALPYLDRIVAIPRALWILYTNEWPDDGF